MISSGGIGHLSRAHSRLGGLVSAICHWPRAVLLPFPMSLMPKNLALGLAPEAHPLGPTVGIIRAKSTHRPRWPGPSCPVSSPWQQLVSMIFFQTSVIL